METDKLQELRAQVEKLKEEANLKTQLKETKRELRALKNAGWVKSWSDAKRDGKELRSVLSNLFLKTEKEVRQNMETDTTNSTDQPVEDHQDMYGGWMDDEHAPAELTI